MRHDDIFRIAPGSPGAQKGDPAAMGLKAYDLSRMARLGLPVPAAFVLGTAHCRRWHRERPERCGKTLAGMLDEQLRWLQAATGLGLGDARNPLLVSVRSGAPVSMPGMMDTLLNIGLCDGTVHGLVRITGTPRLVWDSYRRLVQGFAEVVCGAAARPFEAELEGMLRREQVEHVRDLDSLMLAELTQTYLELFNQLTGKPFPQNPQAQLEAAVQAVFGSWNSARAGEYRRLNGIAEDLFTAAVIQQMVFGNAGGSSGSGVGFTRDPDSGEKTLCFDFLFNSQGEDLVSGRSRGSDAERLFSTLPETGPQLAAVCSALEHEFRDAQEFEFTIQEGRLYLLQTRSAKRSPWAALRIAVELVAEGVLGEAEARAHLAGLNPGEITRTRIVLHDRQPFAQGQPAGIGVAIGPLALDMETARGLYSKEGRQAVLVRDEIATADIAGMALSAGLLTVRGSRTSHGAVVARQLGKPCVTGCNALRIDLNRRLIECGGRFLSEGDLITLDSNTGHVYAGSAETVIDRPTRWLDEIGKWR